MANSIEFAKNYNGILDEVYQRAAVSRCLNSGGRMVRAGRNTKKILIPKISVTGLGDYTRNVGYKTGSIAYEYETHSFGYDRAIRLFADVMDVEESGVLDCFVEAGAELQRTQVAPEGDAYTFSQIAGTAGVTTKSEDLSEAEAGDILAALRAVTNDMDEKQVSTGSRILFITPTLRGVVDEFSLAGSIRKLLAGAHFTSCFTKGLPLVSDCVEPIVLPSVVSINTTHNSEVVSSNPAS